MASGKNHDFSILITTPAVGILSAYYFTPELGIIAGASHLLGGWFLSPDLDLISRPYKRWGVIRWIWLPYMKLIPRHRHWASHGIIVGSAIRLVYLAAWLSPLWLIPEVRSIQWNGLSFQNAIAFLVGVELSALNHLLLDGLLVPLPVGIRQRLKGN